jgi:hypothetical protein
MTNRYGLTSEQTTEKIQNALVVYDPYIHELLNILIEEVKDTPITYVDNEGKVQSFILDGLPWLLCRNPNDLNWACME